MKQLLNHKNQTQGGIKLLSRAAWLSVLLLCTQASVGVALAKDDGGGDGGTNTDKVTHEPVEFQRAEKRVSIDPRTFEGIYDELQPRLQTIEQKIPGLGKDLEKVFDERSWFVTEREFAPRASNEEQPIYQDDQYVLLTASKIKQMSKEQLKKAWLHEAVRCLIQDRRITKSRKYTDFLVEKISVILYSEYMQPEKLLAQALNTFLIDHLYTTGKDLEGELVTGVLSRSEIYKRIYDLNLIEKYDSVCDKNAKIIQKVMSHGNCLNLKNKNIRTYDANESLKTVANCLSDGEKETIVSTLNHLNGPFLEKDGSHKNEFSRVFPDPNYKPMNSYGSLHDGSMFGITEFNYGIDAAISGERLQKSELLDVTVVKLDDSTRAAMAIYTCAFVDGKIPGFAASQNGCALIPEDSTRFMLEEARKARQQVKRNPSSVVPVARSLEEAMGALDRSRAASDSAKQATGLRKSSVTLGDSVQVKTPAADSAR